jgi:hypothetical protein
MTQLVGQFTMAALVLQGQHAWMFEGCDRTYICQTCCHIATKMYHIQGERINKKQYLYREYSRKQEERNTKEQLEKIGYQRSR